MSDTIEKQAEESKILFEGHQRFTEIKETFFKELFESFYRPEAFQIADYCWHGFTQGYLEGYRKAKGEKV